MQTLLRSNVSLAWAALTGLTIISWALGTEHGFGSNHTAASLVIIVVAIFKIRIVGLYFMELREAPIQLRIPFEAYCVALLGLLSAMYLLA
jgi:hypothetical protein